MVQVLSSFALLTVELVIIHEVLDFRLEDITSSHNTCASSMSSFVNVLYGISNV